MQASLLREVIHVFAPNVGRNEFGEQVQKYDYLFSTRAQVEHRYGSRTTENDEIVYPYRKAFTVRSYHHLTEELLIRYGTKFYRILSIDPDPDRDCITVNTEEVNE